MCIVKVRKIFENRLLQSIHTLSLSLNLYIHIVTGSGTIPTENGCNVQKSQDCALQQKCESSDMLYKCTVTTADGAQEFYGLTPNTFKPFFKTIHEFYMFYYVSTVADDRIFARNNLFDFSSFLINYVTDSEFL